MSRLRSQFHAAIGRLSLRLGRYEMAADAYGNAIASGSDDPDARFTRAWCLVYVPDRRAEGIAELQRLLEDSPIAFGFELLANALQQEGRHVEAVTAYREAARLQHPSTSDLYYNCGASLSELRRLNEAAEAFQAAVDLDPTDADSWDELGYTLSLLGQWKAAAPCQLRALRLAPNLARTAKAVATLVELNRLDEAEAVLRDRLASDPRCETSKRLMVGVVTGQDRYDEAIELGRALCAEYPDSSASHFVLSAAFAEAGRFEDAIRHAQTAVDADPSEFSSHAAMGWVLVKMPDGAGALASWDRALECLGPQPERLPSSDWVWGQAGRGAALSLLGRHDEAMASFNALLAVDPTLFDRWPEVAEHYQRSSRAD